MPAILFWFFAVVALSSLLQFRSVSVGVEKKHDGQIGGKKSHKGFNESTKNN